MGDSKESVFVCAVDKTGERGLEGDVMRVANENLIYFQSNALI